MQPKKTVQTDGLGDAALLTHHHFLEFNDSRSQNGTYLVKILRYLSLSGIPTFPGCWKPNIFLCRPNMVVSSKKKSSPLHYENLLMMALAKHVKFDLHICITLK